MHNKRYIVLLLLIALASVSWGFYSTNEANYRNVIDQENNAQISYLDFNAIQPTAYIDSSFFNQKFDSEVEQFLKRWEIKGASVSVVKDNKLVYSRGFGYSNYEEKESVSSTSLFRIASASKLITAVGIMKLVDENQLDLDSLVFGPKGIIKEYKNVLDKNVYKIKVKHLLNHKGGWSWRDGDFMFQPRKIRRLMKLEGPPTQDDIIYFVLNNRRLRYAPGQQYAYSNFGYMLLGKIIEKVSGQSYEKFIQEAILEPNGIHGMKIAGNYLWDKHDKEVMYYDYPNAYNFSSFDGLFESVPKPYGGNDVRTLGAAGAWIATSAQLVKLVSLIDDKNPYRKILSDDAIKQMTVVTNSHDAYGWKGASNGNWWRTGTLAGTHSFIMRKANGFTYAIIVNSSVWMGYRFNWYIKNMMDKALLHFKEKDLNKDLFWQNKPDIYTLPLSS